MSKIEICFFTARILQNQRMEKYEINIALDVFFGLLFVIKLQSTKAKMQRRRNSR
jgi:hypothetical protein